jgi:4-alpha-glucanotransferase
MYVVQYELDSNLKRALRPVPANAVASLNTHDMPPFAAFWQGLDIQSRQELGLLDEAAAQQEMERRQTLKEYLVGLLQSKGQGMTPCVGLQAVLRAALAFLSASRALVVLVNLEDLWQEVQYQNMPGFPKESRNWRRKARYTFDTFYQLPQVVEALNEIDGIRRGGGDLQ